MIVQSEFSAGAFPRILSTAICRVAFAFGPGLLDLRRDISGSYAVPLLLYGALDAIAATVVPTRAKAASEIRTPSTEAERDIEAGP